MCQDYDGQSQAARKFYSHMQAKLYWAVVSHTPSEGLTKRIHADRPNLGLKTWPKENIRQEDALNAKNTLEERELQELNRVTTILLDVFEDQLDVGRLTLMSEATALLDRQLSGLGRPVLRHRGTVSHEDAERHAKRHYKIFDERRRLARKVKAEAALLELKQADKALPKPRKQRKKG